MRRFGLFRILLIVAVIAISVDSLSFQKFDISFLGLRLQRGSNAILGMKLGLDLQGGVHLVYQARGTKEIAVAFQDAVQPDQVRSAMTSLGRKDAVVRAVTDKSVVIQVPTLRKEVRDAAGNVTQPGEQDTIRQALQQLGSLLTYEVKDIRANPSSEQMEGVKGIIERRINPFGVTEPIIQLMGSDRVLLQLPGITNVEEVKRLIGQTARLEFKERTCLNVPPDPRVPYDCDLPQNHEDKETGLTGEDLARSFPGTHPQTGAPIVNLQFNARGTQIFALMTTRLAGKPDRFVIFLDDKEVVAPVVREPILSGSAFIEGQDFTAERVRTISIQLESGRLPIPIEPVQEQDVDATLGAASLHKSLIAGIVGLGMVLLFMVVYYRAAGVVSAVALLIYTGAVLAVFKLWPVTLTLAGIAAFILSIGMAVDANVLIFERMKEELRVGRTLTSAIEIGFGRAWTSIRDSNVSTLITTAILFWFGQRLGASLVSGFAATLAIGVAVSMFSAITVSRTLLQLLAATPVGRAPGLFTPEPLPSRPHRLEPGVAGERG